MQFVNITVYDSTTKFERRNIVWLVRAVKADEVLERGGGA